MSTEELKSGLHTTLDGVDYRLVSTFGWSVWSPTPAPGFTKRPGKTGYFRAIDTRERLPCFDIANRGTYRGIAVEVGSSTKGRVAAYASDPRAGSAGFTQQGRSEWVALIDRSDPDLTFAERRTPVPPPWLR